MTDLGSLNSQKRPSVTELARSLIKINSVAPHGQSEDAGAGGEQQVADWIEGFVRDYGFTCEQIPVLPGRPNIIVRHNTFDPRRPVVALTTHMDTVDVAGMTIDPFAAECRDGALWGRGACDVKGTMAVMLTAMMDWYQRSPASSYNLIFIGTMGEEGGTLGAKAFCQTPESVDMILVGEPTSLQPVVAHKGLWRFAVETRGLSCHSSRPENGENAVENMLRIVQELDKRVKSGFEADQDNTLTYTMLHGGSMVNIVPDSCRLDVDARYHAGTPIEEFVREVGDIIQNHSRSEYIAVQQEPAYQCRPDSCLLALLEEALIDSHRTVERRREPWFSDATHFAAAGYDTLLWGAGDIRYAHTADERIALADLNDAVTVLNRLLSICERRYGA